MEVFKSLNIKNVSTSKELEEIQEVIQRIVKDESLDYQFLAEEKMLIFPKMVETDALNVHFLMN